MIALVHVAPKCSKMFHLILLLSHIRSALSYGCSTWSNCEYWGCTSGSGVIRDTVYCNCIDGNNGYMSFTMNGQKISVADCNHCVTYWMSQGVQYLKKCPDKITCGNCAAGFYMDECPCKPCPVGHYCTGDGSKTPCPAGRYTAYTTASDLGFCQFCNPGFFSYSGSTACTACTPMCPVGYYETQACLYTQDRVCAPCPPNYICTNRFDAIPCRTACPEAHYETTPCTPTTDRVCAYCPVNYFCDTVTATPCNTVCPTSQYRTALCTRSRDLLCSDCPANSYCNGTTFTACRPTCDSETYETTACTSTTNRICTACTTPCTSGTYETTPCTSTTNRVCTPCDIGCPTGEYESSSCTTSVNRVCSPCPPNNYCIGSVFAACATSCGNGTYESTACTNTTNRVCTPLS